MNHLLISAAIIWLFPFQILFAQEQTSPNNSLRVLTFNIFHGATTEGNFDLDKIAEVIEDFNPDLVALQEVDFKTRRARNYDLATELGLRTKMAPLFGKAMDFDGGAYGVGILTRMPIVSSQNVPLPYSAGNEPRTALRVTVEIPSGDTVCFISTHLHHQRDNKDRLAQTAHINQTFTKNIYPAILAGDLNDTPQSEAITRLKDYWTPTTGNAPQPTHPSNNPEKKIDYILYRPEKAWKVIENKVVCDSIATDHCAVFSVLQLLD